MASGGFGWLRVASGGFGSGGFGRLRVASVAHSNTPARAARPSRWLIGRPPDRYALNPKP